MLIYIHGFLSSPLSHKAMQVKEYCEKHHPSIGYICPALTAYPEESITQLESLIENALQEKSKTENPSTSKQTIGLIGSSLGGFYATYLSEKYNLKAVLINPAVAPHTLVANYLHVDLANYHTDQHYQLNESHLETFKALDVSALQHKDNYWLMVQTEDETLDYRAAVKKYQGCRQLAEEGGDHSFQDFDRWLPDVFSFLFD